MPLGALLVVSLFGAAAAVGWPAAARTLRGQDVAAVSMVVAVCLLTALTMRLHTFGTDTQTYAVYYSEYCLSGGIADQKFSYGVASSIIYFVLGGSCDLRLLALGWTCAFLLLLLLIDRRAGEVAVFASLLVVSMVGVEFLTNALRQGMSAIPLAAAVVSYGRRKGRAAALAVLAVALHSSALLVLAAYLMARLNWRLFIGAFIVAIAVTIGLLSTGAWVGLPLASEFFAEIVKYSVHVSDEVAVRGLAMALLWGSIAAGFYAYRSGLSQAQPEFGIALRLALLTLPFSGLPYFGYRLIYSVFPIVLLLLVAPVQATAEARAAYLRLQFSLNFATLLLWSLGSAQMRQAPVF